jgi:hypothetical protein
MLPGSWTLLRYGWRGAGKELTENKAHNQFRNLESLVRLRPTCGSVLVYVIVMTWASALLASFPRFADAIIRILTILNRARHVSSHYRP